MPNEKVWSHASFLDNQGFELLYSVYFCICSIHIIIFRR